MPTCSDPVKEAERRRKLCAAGCGRYKRTPEIRSKNSTALKGKPNPGGKYERTLEVRAKLKKPRPPEVRAKMSASRKGKLTGEDNPTKRPEVRMKQSESAKAHYRTEVGLLQCKKYSFLRAGYLFGCVPRWKRLWRKFLWKLRVWWKR